MESLRQKVAKTVIEEVFDFSCDIFLGSERGKSDSQFIPYSHQH